MSNDNTWVRLRRFEIELALEAAFAGGYAARQTDARAEGADWRAGQQTDFVQAKVDDSRKAAFEANLKVLNSAGQALQANANALEAISHLVDNMGRL